MEQNGRLKFYARQLQNCIIQILKMQSSQIFGMHFLSNSVKYCIRKITIFSKIRKVQVTVLYTSITLTLEVLILSLVSSRLN